MFLFWLKSPKIGAKSLFWALSSKKKMLRRVDLAPLFLDLSQREKLSEIKPPLAIWLHTAIKYHRQSLDSKKSIAQLTIAAISILIIIAEHIIAQWGQSFFDITIKFLYCTFISWKVFKIFRAVIFLFHRLINQLKLKHNLLRSIVCLISKLSWVKCFTNMM